MTIKMIVSSLGFCANARFTLLKLAMTCLLFCCDADMSMAVSLSRAREDSKLSIFTFIRDNIDEKTGELRESALELPDEEFRFSHVGVHWAPGALDGMSTRVQTRQNEPSVDKIIQILDKIANTDSEPAKAELYGLLMNDEII